MRTVLEAVFSPDEVHEIGDNIEYALHDLPVDEHGFIKGSLIVKVEFVPKCD